MSRYFLVAVLSLLLAACKSTLVSPGAPTNFQVKAGDSQVVMTWDEDTNQIYTVYYKVGPDVTTASYDGLKTPIHSPYTLTGLVNQTQYAFILNASNHGSVPGPATSVVTATPGAVGSGNWTVGTTLSGLTGRNMHHIAYDGVSTYVAVGDARSLFITTDGSSSSGIGSWTAPVNPLPVGVNTNITSAVYAALQFAVLAVDGTTIISRDTVNWTVAKAVPIPSPTTQTMNDMAYGAGLYVVVGSDGLIFTNASSTITSDWTSQTSNTTNDLYGVSYINGLFVALGKGGTVVTSNDGVNWFVETSGTASNLYRAAYGAGTFVAVGDNGTVISSPDGVNWTSQTKPTGQHLYGVAYGVNGQFIAVGTGGSVVSSATGMDNSWTEITVGNASMNDVVAGKVFVAVGDAGASISGK